jgi:hypothetical protein
LAEFREPDQGRRMQQGAFILRAQAWTAQFCPVFQRMRAPHVRDYNEALQRYEKW